MDLLKVLVIGIIISILSVFLRQIKPEYSVLCIVTGSILLLFYIVNSMTDMLSFFRDIVNKTGIDSNLFRWLWFKNY